MSEGEILRRDGYWPSSPVVGPRGTQTRRRIVAETLRLFEAEGFHGTSVDAIARAAGTSRATLYQYFANKEQIFVELLEECGAALTRVVRRLGPLGPTDEGFENLHWWLGEWAWVYDRYATVFVQWTSVDTESVRPLVHGFVRSYNSRLTDRLVTSGVSGLDPDVAALALTSLVHRFNYFRHRGNVPLPPLEATLDGLAVVLQLMLFPRTPVAVFDRLPRTAPARSVSESESVSVSESESVSVSVSVSVEGTAPAAAPLPLAWPGVPGPVGQPPALSPRAAATVAGLLTAGATLFAERGYHGTGVDALVAEAGFARATFYKYFDDKLDLLRRLSAEAAVLARELSDRLAAIELTGGSPDALPTWFADFLLFHRRYLGVFRGWVEGSVDDPALVGMAERANASMHSAALRLLAQVRRSYPLDPDVAAAVFLGVLDRLPEAVAEAGLDLDDAAMVDLMTTLTTRALLTPT